MTTTDKRTPLFLLSLIIAIGLNMFVLITSDPDTWANEENSKWEFNDCGKIRLIDRVESSGSFVSYYVTYYSEYKNDYRTLSVSPNAYVNALEYQSKGYNICFSVATGAQDVAQLIYVVNVICIIACFITLLVIAIPFYKTPTSK